MARTPHPLCLIRAMIALEALDEARAAFPDGTLKPEARIPCRPEGRNLTGMHKHVCDNCHTAWQHDDRLPLLCSEDENREAHTCPSCGAEQWYKHLPSIF